jgi:hypothetical protein
VYDATRTFGHKPFILKERIQRLYRSLKYTRIDCGLSPTIGPVKSLNGLAIGETVPGPVTISLIKAWNEMVGIDIVGQALAHVTDPDKQQALGIWEKLRDG